MTSKNSRALNEEDRILWSKVARTATPLKGKQLLSDPVPDVPPADMLATAGQAPEPSITGIGIRPAVPAPKQPHSIDATTRKKLSRGRLAIQGRVDLHGLTQSEAHSLLFSFLHQAYAEGLRYVLVITGKGSSLGSDGVLRRAVPAWLATQPFRAMVSGYEAAARNHGGAGALYIRLRRRDGTDR